MSGPAPTVRYTADMTRPAVANSSTDKTRAHAPRMPAVYVRIDQRDLLNFFTGTHMRACARAHTRAHARLTRARRSGGLNAIKAISTGAVTVRGDLLLGRAMIDVFKKVPCAHACACAPVFDTCWAATAPGARRREDARVPQQVPQGAQGGVSGVSGGGVARRPDAARAQALTADTAARAV